MTDTDSDSWPVAPRKIFSAFALAKLAIRGAKADRGGITFTLSGDEYQSMAAGTVLAVASAFLSGAVLDTNEQETLEFLNGEDGGKIATVNIRHEDAGTIKMVRNGETNTTTISFPLKHGIGLEQAKTAFKGVVDRVQNLAVQGLGQPLRKVEVRNEGTDMDGRYLFIPARDAANAIIMGKLLAKTAAAQGFTNHVHRVTEGEHPGVLIRSEAKEAILAAEKISDLPPF